MLTFQKSDDSIQPCHVHHRMTHPLLETGCSYTFVIFVVQQVKCSVINNTYITYVQVIYVTFVFESFSSIYVSFEFGEIQKISRLAVQAGESNNNSKLYFHVKKTGHNYTS